MKINYLHKTCLALAVLFATSLNLEANNGVRVSAKVLLSGPLAPNGLMRDALREKGLLPTTEPYSGLQGFQHFGEGGGETVNPAVFQVTGDNAIVDWVVLELRKPSSIGTPVATKAVLLQRDGDVVDTDGLSPVHFTFVKKGKYHVSVRHRNHLGVMTAAAIQLNATATQINFSSESLELWGTNGSTNIGGKMALWLGDSNHDKKVIQQGPGNDFLTLFTTVLYATGNEAFNVNFMAEGYFTADTNMDGYAVYLGPSNDRSNVFLQSIAATGSMNAGLLEQIPD